MAIPVKDAIAKKASLFDAVPFPTFAVAANGTIAELNLAALSLLGFRTKPELLQKNFLEVCVADEDRPETSVRLNETLEGAGAEGKLTKVTLVTRAGRKQVILCMATSRSPEGRIDGAVISAQEMTPLRSVAGGGAASGGAEHLSGALDASGAPIFCVDLEGRVLEWSLKVEKVTGLSKGQVQGQDFTSQCIAETFHKATRKALDQARRGLEVGRFNVTLANEENGKETWISLAPWRSATGIIVGTVGLMDEAAEMDRRLSELEWLRCSMSELLDRANALVFAVDSSGAITEWNHRLSDLLGKEKDVVAGKKLADLVDGSSAKAAEEAIQVALGGLLGPALQITLKPDIRMIVGMSPQFSATGKVIGAFCVGQQVSAAPAAAGPAASLATDGMFESGASRKTKGMVMHELRSPLHGIIGLSNTLSHDTSPMQKPLLMINSSADRVLELVSNLMDYWNLADEEAGYEGSPGELVDISSLAKEVVTRAEGMKDKRGKPLKNNKVELARQLDSAVLTGDAMSLTQMLNHLIINALKFTASGTVKVSTMVEEGTKAVIIMVEDTGIGINPDCIDRMFEAFAQEDDSESRKYDGIGLGLAIVRQVVRIHNGTYKVVSTQKKGSVFTITLPSTRPAKGLAKALPASASASSSAPAAAASAAQLVKESVKVPLPGSAPRDAASSWLGPATQLGVNIAVAKSNVTGASIGASRTATTLPTFKDNLPLISHHFSNEQKVIMSVDDDFVNQEVMKSVLEPFGFKIVACMSGSECLEYFDTEQIMPQLILLDVMMPGLSGFDVLQAQRKKYSPEQLPILMVSAKNNTQSVVKGFEMGCNDWIHKPFDRQELNARVKVHMRTRDTILQYQMLAMQSSCRDDTSRILEEERSQTFKSSKELPDITEIREGSIDTTALFAMVVAQTASESVMKKLFEIFESESTKHAAVKTEIVGSCYIAVAINQGEDTRHADKMLRLALMLQEATREVGANLGPASAVSIKIGIHTTSAVAPVICGHGGIQRQYPSSCLFSDTVRMAKLLCDKAMTGRIILTRAARTRLSADVEDELQHSGLKMVTGQPSSLVDEHFVVARTDEVNVKAIEEPFASAPPPKAASGPASLQPRSLDDASMQREMVQLSQHQQQHQTALEEERACLQAMLSATQEELRRVSLAFGQAQRQLQVTEEQAHHAKQEARSLYTQLHAVSSGAAAERSQANGGHLSPPVDRHAGAPPLPEGVASASQSSTSASLLFLQWQNAHLHAEVRHFQQALSAAKSELQMQLMAGQLLESKHGLLQARVEHLELDLGFKQACGGGGSGMPPFGNGMDDMFAACDLGGLGGPFNRAGSGPGATFLEGSVAGGYGPGANGPVGMGGFGAGSVGMGSSFHEGSVAGGFGPTANGPVGMGSGGFAGGLGKPFGGLGSLNFGPQDPVQNGSGLPMGNFTMPAGMTAGQFGFSPGMGPGK